MLPAGESVNGGDGIGRGWGVNETLPHAGPAGDQDRCNASPSAAPGIAPAMGATM